MGAGHKCCLLLKPREMIVGQVVRAFFTLASLHRAKAPLRRDEATLFRVSTTLLSGGARGSGGISMTCCTWSSTGYCTFKLFSQLGGMQNKGMSDSNLLLSWAGSGCCDTTPDIGQTQLRLSLLRCESRAAVLPSPLVLLDNENTVCTSTGSNPLHW